jgi:Homeodomain-like domain
MRDTDVQNQTAGLDPRQEAWRLHHDEGLSFQRVAERLGVSRTTIHRWHVEAGGHVDRRLSRMVEPIPASPFLDWCDRRKEMIRREWDACPAIGGHPGFDDQCGPVTRLVMELGWSDRPDSACRRLHRLRFDNATGMASRPMVEDALWHAGVHIYEVYPELEAIDMGECVAA